VGQFKDVNGTTTGYASYGNQELAEYIGVSTLAFTRLCIYGPGLDEPVARNSRPPPLLQRISLYYLRKDSDPTRDDGSLS
jgi:hypothetical protein